MEIRISGLQWPVRWKCDRFAPDTQQMFADAGDDGVFFCQRKLFCQNLHRNAPFYKLFELSISVSREKSVSGQGLLENAGAAPIQP